MARLGHDKHNGTGAQWHGLAMMSTPARLTIQGCCYRTQPAHIFEHVQERKYRAYLCTFVVRVENAVHAL
eukprot:scaffold18538_cov24-Tisochrysis_lutea.AAC.1